MASRGSRFADAIYLLVLELIRFTDHRDAQALSDAQVRVAAHRDAIARLFDEEAAK